MLTKFFKTYNGGQYGLKPWAANLIMGILELLLIIGWIFVTARSYMKSILELDLEATIDTLNEAGIVLVCLMLIWNLLVWFIKPLRTKFNYSESLWNIVFIVLTIIDMVKQ